MTQVPHALAVDIARLREQGYEIAGETEEELRTQCLLATVEIAARLLEGRKQGSGARGQGSEAEGSKAA